jgi:hypothetical protein
MMCVKKYLRVAEAPYGVLQPPSTTAGTSYTSLTTEFAILTESHLLHPCQRHRFSSRLYLGEKVRDTRRSKLLHETYMMIVSGVKGNTPMPCVRRRDHEKQEQYGIRSDVGRLFDNY